MSKKSDQSLPLREKAPKAVSLNKGLIIGLAIIVVVILLWSIFFGFGKRSKSSSDSAVTPSTGANSSLRKLPSGYQDAKGIAGYLPDRQSEAMKKLQQQLASLESSQSSLRQQLAALRRRPTQQAPVERPNENQNNTNLSQANRSNIFFNQGSPRSNEATRVGAKAAAKAATNNAAAGKAPESTESSYQKQNMQSQKLDFIGGSSDSKDSVYNPHNLIAPISPYEVQAGTVIPTVLITSVNSSLPGTAVAQVRENVYDTVTGRYLLIPKGTKAICTYDSSVAYGQSRVLMVCERLVMPNGDSIELSKFVSADAQGASGVEGDVDNHWLKILGAATLSSVLSLGSGIAGYGLGGGNNDNFYPTPAESALYSAAGSISSTGQQLTSRAINIQPTLTLPPGYEFNIIVNKDVVLEPYRGRSISAS